MPNHKNSGEHSFIKINGVYRENSIIGYSIFDVPLHPTHVWGLTVRFDLLDHETFFHFSQHSHPAWSKSGKWLAFVRNGDIWIAPEAISWMRRSGEEKDSGSGMCNDLLRSLPTILSLTGPVEKIMGSHLSWSPDEKFLAYGIRRLGGSGFEEVHLLKLNSEDDKPEDYLLIENGEDPRFSPDGNFVAYHHAGNIFIAFIDGKFKAQLIKNAEQPAW